MRVVRDLRVAGVFAILISVLLASSARAQDGQVTTLRVGYIPLLPMSQLFVIEGEGWDKEAGLELKKTRFSEGPGIVQALVSGTLDVVYFGIGPAMVAKSNGVDIRVVASNVIEQIAFVARGDLAKYSEGTSAKEAIARFTSEKGHRPRIATLPKGSVPDTVFRHWLVKVAELKENDVELIGMGADRVQQALLAGSVDGASILEPIVTVVLEKVPGAKVVAYGGAMMANQPGAVLAVRGELAKKNPDAVRKLVELHNRATELLSSDPKRAAKHVHQALGHGLIPVGLVERAITSPYSKFVSNPHQIVDATKAMHDFQLEIGTLRKPVPLADLFDTSFYDTTTIAP